jgi:hypothetical protein
MVRGGASLSEPQTRLRQTRSAYAERVKFFVDATWQITPAYAGSTLPDLLR